MSQSVCDGESSIALQLRQNYKHLSEREKDKASFVSIHDWYILSPSMDDVCCSEPVQRRDAVDGFEAAARRHHIETVAAVTRHVQVVSGVSVLYHDD